MQELNTSLITLQHENIETVIKTVLALEFILSYHFFSLVGRGTLRHFTLSMVVGGAKSLPLALWQCPFTISCQTSLKYLCRYPWWGYILHLVLGFIADNPGCSKVSWCNKRNVLCMSSLCLVCHSTSPIWLPTHSWNWELWYCGMVVTTQYSVFALFFLTPSLIKGRNDWGGGTWGEA